MRLRLALALVSLVPIALALDGCNDSATAPIDPSIPRLLVTSGATDEVLILDARDGSLLQTILTERRRDEIDEPHGIVVSPDGRNWYVTLAHGEPTLWKYELPDNRLVGRVELGTYGAARIGVTPDAARSFIPDYYRSGQGEMSGLAVVELNDLTIVDRPIVCPAPHDAQVHPAGQLVAIACSLSDEVVILDVSTLEEVRRFFVDAQPGPPGTPTFKPLNLVWSPGGDTLYVGLHAAAAVRAFDLDGTGLGTVAVGAGPAQIALTRDGRTLITANRNDDSVSLIDVPSLSERVRIPLEASHPHGVVLDDEDTTAYLTYEGNIGGMGGVLAIDLTDADVSWSVEAGAFTLGIAYVPGEVE
jgi:DNA-binding beta-propeller fold protein YncE